jgi:hypothetical protein
MIKKYIGLAVGLILLTMAWHALQKPVYQPQDLPDWATIDASMIDRIIIQNSGMDGLVLSQKQGQWYVQGSALANQQAVTHLRDDLAEMRPTRILTYGHKHDAELGFAPVSTHVQCLDKQGNLLLDIEVGKQGSNLLSTYVRRVGSDTIVAVDKILLWQLKRTKGGWKDTTKPTQ